MDQFLDNTEQSIAISGFDVEPSISSEQKIGNLREEQKELLQKRAQIDDMIISIQRSTRVTFSGLASLHNYCRSKFAWYYAWHLKPYASIVHTLFFLTFLVWQIFIIIRPLLILV